MATATAVRQRWQAATLAFEQAQAGTEKSWFKVWFQAGDPDAPHLDFHVVKASNPVEARCRVEEHERSIARALGRHSVCSPDTIHAISVDVLPDHSHGEVDG